MAEILEIKRLKKHFDVGKGGTLKAVDDVSFTIMQGETFGLVGESGCGKSTTGRIITRLLESTEGEVIFKGKNVNKLDKKDNRKFHQEMQMVFQDPYASLNPRMLVRDIIAEGYDINGLYKGKEREDKVNELLKMVGLSPIHANQYPHEFSGGQRQRIGIARAISLKPDFIVADEPISALDVSVQSQIVNLFMELQRKNKLTYLFISHNLSMMRLISDRIGVMYLGNLVEIAPSESLFSNPLHPYTSALIEAIPIPDPIIEAKKYQLKIKGELQNPIHFSNGCVYQNRCPHVQNVCLFEKPNLKETSKNHYVACHLN